MQIEVNRVRWTQRLMREVACEERESLGLGPRDPFDPYALCEAHGIPVYPITELADWAVDQRVLDYFTADRASAWSAALIPLGAARLIVENDGHLLVRRRSSIAHELGHHLLEHKFEGIVLGEDHRRQFNDQLEKQANFLAGELLVPLAAAERMAFDGWDNNRVAAAYNVSTQFAQMQMYGQRVRARKAAAKYGVNSRV